MEDRNILKNIKYLAPVLIILTAALMRLLPHPPNFTPIGALALFGGASLGGIWALLIPISAMLVSDFFLGFHSTMPYVYLSLLLIVFMGTALRKRQEFNVIVGASLCASILFFVITNFGVWYSTNMYPKTFYGLLLSYTAGLPFLRNALAGDLFYTLGLFYGYNYSIAIAKKYYLAKIK